MAPAPLLTLSPIYETLSTRATLNYSTPFVGNALKQPFFSISNGDIICSSANVSYGGSSPPFQLSWQAYPPSSHYNGSFYNPPLEGSLGVYPEAGTSGWNVTASLPEGSWVRLRVQDGGGSISFDSVREVKNGTDGVDGCSTPKNDDWSPLYYFLCVIGGVAVFTFLFLLYLSLFEAHRKRGIIAEPPAERVVVRQAPQAPPVVTANQRQPTQEVFRAGGAGGAAAVTGEGLEAAEVNPPSYEMQINGKVAGGV